MKALVLSLLLVTSYLGMLSSPLVYSPIVQSVSDAGNRYKVCFTATDTVGNSTVSTTLCTYITVVGACTLATADVNIDGRVNILDVAIIASHYGENRTSPQPYNPLDTSTVGLSDIACAASYYDQIDPLP